MIRKEGPLHAVMIATAVVFFWRGAWGLMDLYLIPSNQVTSMVVSLVIGLIILIFTRSIVKLD